MTTYVGFAFAASMIEGDAKIKVEHITALMATRIINQARRDGNFVSCANRHHLATCEAVKMAYRIDVEAPDVPPKVTLDVGDQIVVISVTGLPRLAEAREYTKEEIDGADFRFSVWTREE